METDESPEPDRSSPESSPETSPPGTSSAIILTPPTAFADLSCFRTAAAHHHRNYPALSLGLPPDRGASFALWGRRSPSALQGQDNPLTVLADAALLRTPAAPADDTLSHAVSPGSSGTLVCPVRGDPLLDSSTAMVTVTTTLQRGSASVTASASVMNSTFAVRSPSFTALQSPSGSSPTQRTPATLATDSAMGRCNFAVQNSPGSLSLRLASNSDAPGTPTIMVTDSVMGDSTFALRSPPSLAASDSTPTTTATTTPSVVVATDSQTGRSCAFFAARSASPDSPLPAFSSALLLQSTPSILVTDSVMGSSPMRTPGASALQPESSPASQSHRHALSLAAPGPFFGTSSLPGSPGPCSMGPALAEKRESEQLMEVTSAPASGDNTYENLVSA